MKRIIALMLVLSLAMSLVGCASKEEKEAAAEVVELIDEIGSVSLDSEEAITEAQDAYDDLTDRAKKLVKNYEDLEAAQEELDEALEEAAQEVIDLIDGIGTVTLDSEQAIDEAQAAYDLLPESAKELVENDDVLEKAHEELLAVFTEKTDLMADVMEQINSAMDGFDAVTVVTLIEEYLPLAEQLEQSKLYTLEAEGVSMLNEIYSLMDQICYANTNIITLDNYIKLASVSSATAYNSNEGELVNVESDTGMECFTYMYDTATKWSNAFSAYTEYIETYFTLTDTESTSSSLRCYYEDELGREFFVEMCYYDLGSYGVYAWVLVGFDPATGVSEGLTG